VAADPRALAIAFSSDPLWSIAAAAITPLLSAHALMPANFPLLIVTGMFFSPYAHNVLPGTLGVPVRFRVTGAHCLLSTNNALLYREKYKVHKKKVVEQTCDNSSNIRMAWIIIPPDWQKLLFGQAHKARRPLYPSSVRTSL
jgi:hypothetical protein